MMTATAARARLARIKEAASETVGQVLQTAEVAGSAGAFAWVNGRYGAVQQKTGATFDPEHQIFGMPTDLAGAVILHGLSLTGMLGKYKEHGHNLGDGALASFVTRKAITMGITAKNKSTQGAAATQAAPATKTAGYG